MLLDELENFYDDDDSHNYCKQSFDYLEINQKNKNMPLASS